MPSFNNNKMNLMQIKLKKLIIRNFKGLKDFEADFQHITNVYGQNASGKTTLFDAFLWLFFGKNSEDASVFEVKRLDENGSFIRDLEAEVEAIIHVDDQEIAIKKILRQKWVKRRGEAIPAYQGDENVYFWNDVPMKETEFRVKIKGLVDESIFRLITNPFYFNLLKWQERRNILVSMAGDITDEAVLNTVMGKNKSSFDALAKALNQKKTIEEFKKEIAVKKKKIKDELEQFQPRIDEVKRGMPEALNFSEIRTEIKELEQQIQDIQNALNDEVSKQNAENATRTRMLKEYNEMVQAKQQRSFDLKSKIQNIEFSARQYAKDHGGSLESEIITVENKIENKVAERSRYQSALSSLTHFLKENEAKLEALRDEYVVISEKELAPFDDHVFNCPTCKQSLPEGDIEAKKAELTENFNKKKIEDLETLSKKAALLKEEIKSLEDRITKGNTSIAECSSQITSLTIEKENLQKKKAAAKSEDELKQEYLQKDASYQSLLAELKACEEQEIIAPVFEPTQQNDELIQKKTALNARIMELHRDLNKEEQIKAAEKRIQELLDQEATQSQELASLEGTEFAIMQFTKAKVDMIESRINGKFKHVRFRMFDKQVNGGEAETCETLVNSNGAWVPFSDANNAAKVNAGLDIINALCRNYDAYAPVFLDNRESVTNIIETDSQLVNLIVSGADKVLRVA